MAQITASLVKELRERTGAGMMDCKKALQQTDGNIEAAIDYLREMVSLKQLKKLTESLQKVFLILKLKVTKLLS